MRPTAKMRFPMKKITSLNITVLLLLLLAFTTQAQNKKLIFNNGQETDIQGNATININTGDITVQPVNNKLIVDEPASQKAIIGFYPSQYAIDQGDQIDVNWAVSFTDNTNCSASVTQGTALWSGNKNAGPGSYVQPNVTVTQLPATLRLTCNNYNGGSSYQDFQLVQAETGGGTPTNPVINTFQLTNYPGVNPTIPNSGNYTIEWSVSNLTDTQSGCTASNTALNPGGWAGTRGSSGSESIFIDGAPVLRLTCSNPGGSNVQKAITITNSGGGGNPSCNNAWLPPALTAVNFNYTDTYVGGLPQPPAVPNQNGFGNPFNDISNTSKSMINYIDPESQYITISGMTVPSSPVDRKFTFNTSPGYGKTNLSTVSISECQGDFNPSTARCIMPLSTTGSLNLSNRTEVANSGWGAQDNFCHLEPGATYYINFVFAPTYDGVIKNNVVEGEECLEAVSKKCSIFWGEKGWAPGGL